MIERVSDGLFRAEVRKGAVFSDDLQYRYRLWRRWGDEGRGRVAFLLLNPSTATEVDDDATLRRCESFARRWGFDALDLVNLYAYRSAHPADLRIQSEPIGPDNDRFLVEVAEQAATIILGWGNNHLGGRRRRDVLELLRPFESKLCCLGTTLAGEPRHPLYIPGDCVRVPFAVGPYLAQVAA